MIEGYDVAYIIGGLVLSLAAFSLIFGDNYLFRLAASIMSGALSAYICVVIVESYFYPLILEIVDNSVQLSSVQIIRAVLIIVGIVLLFSKAYSAGKSGGNVIMTILMVICAVVLVLGAAGGTIPSFIRALSGPFRVATLPEETKSDVWYWIKNGTMLFSALAALLFTRHYDLPRKNNSEKGSESLLGNIVVGFTFGAIAAAVFVTAANLLVNHISGMMLAAQSLAK